MTRPNSLACHHLHFYILLFTLLGNISTASTRNIHDALFHIQKSSPEGRQVLQTWTYSDPKNKPSDLTISKALKLDRYNSSITNRLNELLRVHEQAIRMANRSIARNKNMPHNVLVRFEKLLQEAYDLFTLFGSREALNVFWKTSEYDKSRKLLAHLSGTTLDRPHRLGAFCHENTEAKGSNIPPTYDQPVININLVQASLDKNQNVLEYYLGDFSLYVILITSDQIRIQKLKADHNFRKNLELFRTALRSADAITRSGNFINSAHSLYNYLIKPIEQFIKGKKLTIVASSDLTLIPFEALLTDPFNGTTKLDLKSLPYLVKNFSIGYANSMTLLHHFWDTTNSKNNGRVLAYSPSLQDLDVNSNKLNTRNSIVPLKWAADEVGQIANQFPSDMFFEDNATESRFKTIAKDYRVIHIASHGMVHKSDPLRSKISLSTSMQDTVNDGYLHTYELFNTRLNAEMAVLSACSTGDGKVQRGEGVMSLANGFLHSGVKSTVMSLWPANDESTAKIMEHFYHNLSKGMSKDEALRQAKLDYLDASDNLRAHPFYWAQFIANGNMKPIAKVGQSNPRIYWLVILLIPLIIPPILRRQRLSNHNLTKT